MHYKKHIVLWAVSSSVVLAASGVRADSSTEKLELKPMEVIGVAPLAGSGLDADKVPKSVQTVTGDDLEQAQSVSLAEYMNRYLGSVHINDVQNNPFQPDVQYRGFTASPLLGLPQGLSVYLNGVRFNEPFGDTVNWDLIPEGAIDRVQLMPGSNPVYGLNSLGGALAMQTKNGFSAPQHQFEIYGGSWGRHSEEIISGANNGTFGYFLDLRNFRENGWRDESESDVKQALSTLSWRMDDVAKLDLTLAVNDNQLNGNGAVPIQLFQQSREAVFTYPDQTITRLFLSALDGSAWLNDHIQLSGNVYFRQNKIRTFNGDDSDFEPCNEDDDDDDSAVTDSGGEAEEEGLLCEESGDEKEVAVDVDGNPIEADDEVIGATNNTSQTHQRGYGANLQTAFTYPIAGFDNHLLVGASYDQGEVHFESDTELGALTEDRGTTRSGVFVDEARVRLNTRTESYGLFFSDTFSLTEDLALTVSGRYNQTRVNLDDRHGEELDGTHIFRRFNPAYGLTYSPIPEFSLYGGYSEASRAPTPMELSCADPEDPCKLPNAFISDPPLEQVVSKTWEGGFRGRFAELAGGHLEWNAGVFNTENHDDILFISAGNLASEGFFRNVGETRRRGIELGLTGGFFDERWRFSTHYSYIDAKFRDGFTANSPNNPSAGENGQIQVRNGNRIPGIPDHIFKFSTDVDVLPQWTLGIDARFNSEQFFRGDEANLNDPVSAFWVFNLRTEYRFSDYVTVFGRVDNLFDRKYKSFGLYGEPDEVLGDDFDDPRFFGVGAPRAGWIGLRVTF